jgi:hypothetical protein
MTAQCQEPPAKASIWSDIQVWRYGFFQFESLTDCPYLREEGEPEGAESVVESRAEEGAAACGAGGQAEEDGQERGEVPGSEHRREKKLRHSRFNLIRTLGNQLSVRPPSSARIPVHTVVVVRRRQ